MVVLLVHNHYRHPGGEDVVFEAEASLLAENGHEVVRFVLHNESTQQVGGLQLAAKTVWNHDVYRGLRQIMRERRPRIMHVHNTLPLVSPAAYHAASAEGVPVVQTLHNFRLVCPSGILYRKGRVCESCTRRALPWPGVAHACYRDSRAATGAVAAMLSVHRLMGTWQRKVDAYVTLTEFTRERFAEYGLPEKRLHVKPNFVSPTPEVGDGDGGYAVFVGRLVPEKGVDCLLEAMAALEGRIAMHIIGDGPLAPRVKEAAKSMRGVTWLGQRPLDEVYRMMGRAAFVVVPSTWYETFCRVIVESFACGTPVVASNHGAMAEIVDHGRTGLLFRPGDSSDLARRIAWAVDRPHALAEMRGEARREFEARYTARENYRRLMDIYRRAENAA